MSADAASIPVVDFSSMSLSMGDEEMPNDADVKSTAEQLMTAFTSLGFVYLRNTGFPDQLLEEINSAAEKFFNLPDTIKSRYPYGAENHGWVQLEQERLHPGHPGDLKECFDVNLTALRDDSRWPSEVPHFKRTVLECFEVCSRLALRVLSAIAVGLNMKDVNYFAKCHRGIDRPGGTACMRILKYPSLLSTTDIKPNQTRLGEHTDYGSITLLFQSDVPGLQVRTVGGQWIDAVPIANTILVNIGDLMQRWTADHLVSTPHRVTIPEDETKRLSVRRSLAFFAHPDPDVIISCVDGSHKYPPVNSAQYLDDKVKASYIQQNVSCS